MRQIKFKGVFKVRDNGYYSEDEKNYIESKRHEILSISIGSHCTIAYQDTVMTVFEMQCSNYDILQFTGLVDRNGKEIYEGDILLKGFRHYSIEYNKGGFWLINNNGLRVCRISDHENDSDIIGNIHDNLNKKTSKYENRI